MTTIRWLEEDPRPLSPRLLVSSAQSLCCGPSVSCAHTLKSCSHYLHCLEPHRQSIVNCCFLFLQRFPVQTRAIVKSDSWLFPKFLSSASELSLPWTASLSVHFYHQEKYMAFSFYTRGKPTFLFHLVSVTMDKMRPGEQKNMADPGCWTVQSHLACAPCSHEPRVDWNGEGGTGFQIRRGDNSQSSPCLPVRISVQIVLWCITT